MTDAQREREERGGQWRVCVRHWNGVTFTMEYAPTADAADQRLAELGKSPHRPPGTTLFKSPILQAV